MYYEGFVAEAIAAYVASAEVMDMTGQPHRGLLSDADLAAWQPRVEEPLTFDYDGLTICKTGPWGQGPVFLQQLALLAGFDLEAMGAGRTEFIHTVTECAKLAFADREAWYGDPDFTDVPVKALLSAEYCRRPAPPGRGRRPRPSCAPDPRTAGRRGCPRSSPSPLLTGLTGAAETRPSRPAVRRPRATVRATPSIWTWPTGSATWSRLPRAAAGCSPRRSSPGWASAWAPGRRCSPSRPGCPLRSRPASGHGPRSAPASC